ncbi:hypothetical protein K1719_022266 [Acacia pycnantha]|nr:hypothetical protein K1719_022266 [Acacia pycnantha]
MIDDRWFHPLITSCRHRHEDPTVARGHLHRSGISFFPDMEAQRLRELMSLWSTLQSTRVALVGGNHTASRFCTR